MTIVLYLELNERWENEVMCWVGACKNYDKWTHKEKWHVYETKDPEGTTSVNQNNEAPKFSKKFGSRHQLTWTWSLRGNKKWQKNTVTSNSEGSAPKEFGDKMDRVENIRIRMFCFSFEKIRLSVKWKKGSFLRRNTLVLIPEKHTCSSGVHIVDP